VQLAGTAVTDRDTFALAQILRDAGFADVAEKLEKGMTLGTRILGLSITDRESMLRALDDPPSAGLDELRGVLLQEHEWRVREGLV
jgi:hypothetical protein